MLGTQSKPIMETSVKLNELTKALTTRADWMRVRWPSYSIGYRRGNAMTLQDGVDRSATRQCLGRDRLSVSDHLVEVRKIKSFKVCLVQAHQSSFNLRRNMDCIVVAVILVNEGLFTVLPLCLYEP